MLCMFLNLYTNAHRNFIEHCQNCTYYLIHFILFNLTQFSKTKAPGKEERQFQIQTAAISLEADITAARQVRLAGRFICETV